MWLSFLGVFFAMHMPSPVMIHACEQVLSGTLAKLREVTSDGAYHHALLVLGTLATTLYQEARRHTPTSPLPASQTKPDARNLYLVPKPRAVRATHGPK